MTVFLRAADEPGAAAGREPPWSPTTRPSRRSWCTEAGEVASVARAYMGRLPGTTAASARVDEELPLSNLKITE